MKSFRSAAAVVLAASLFCAPAALGAKKYGGRAEIQTMSKTPYAGAVVIEAASGRVLFEDNADTTCYPASVIKLMILQVVLNKVAAGETSFDAKIRITAEAAKIGGSQVYLKEREEFTLDQLLYALAVQSANDAATALAIHLAGTKPAFVDLMNQEAQRLGMKFTVFHSVHGLPPAKDQLPDVSTPRDISLLCQALLKHADTLRYTSVRTLPFRSEGPKPFMMQNHNHLLWSFDGCDGFKTGYFKAAGYSVAATALRKNQRVITVVMGSVDRKVRDAKAAELMNKGFAALSAAPAPTPAAPKAEK